MPPAHVRLAALPVLLAALALSACGPVEPVPPVEASPTPQGMQTPDPSESDAAGPVPLEDLFLSAEGLGSLLLGVAAADDPELGLVHLDPVACTDDVTGFDLGIDPGSPLAPLWIANDAYFVAERPVFGVNIDPTGFVSRIDLFSEHIPTDQGIRLGDPADVVLEAYPDAEIIEGDLSDLLVVEGPDGILQLEIAREREIFDTPYWSEAQVDRVLYISAVFGSQPFSVAGSDNIAGVCPF